MPCPTAGGTETIPAKPTAIAARQYNGQFTNAVRMIFVFRVKALPRVANDHSLCNLFVNRSRGASGVTHYGDEAGGQSAKRREVNCDYLLTSPSGSIVLPANCLRTWSFYVSKRRGGERQPIFVACSD